MSRKRADDFPYDIPACMGWEIPEPSTTIEEWQDGRCAGCGYHDGKLMHDHDHKTGLERGLLCRGCNTHEGVSDAPQWIRWRAGWNPCTLLGDERVYDGGWAWEAKQRWEAMNPEPTWAELVAAVNRIPSVSDLPSEDA